MTSIINEDDDIISLNGHGSILCDPQRNVHKYLVLILICLLTFGSYFCYDNPAALQSNIISDMEISNSQYVLLYSFYSWPNVVLSVVGGYLIDKVFGIRLAAIIFGMIVFLGQLFFALGALFNSIITMYVGRFFFGIGGESLAVSQNAYASSWFKSSELNFVFGLQLSVARIGSTVNMNVMAPLYNSMSHAFTGHKLLGVTFFVASSFCILSFIIAVILWFFDRRAKAILHKSAAQVGDEVRIKDVLKMPLSLWIISIICVFYYAAIFPFVSVAQLFFVRKYDFTIAQANLCNGLIFILSAIISPIAGFLVDFTGKNVFWVLLGTGFTIMVHAIFAFLDVITPFFNVVLLGVSYSILASSLWPMVAIVVPKHLLGTAYGIMQAIQNLGLALVNIVSGIIIDKFGYLYLELFFILCLSIAITAVFVLYVQDRAHGAILNESCRARKARQSANELEISSQ